MNMSGFIKKAENLGVRVDEEYSIMFSPEGKVFGKNDWHAVGFKSPEEANQALETGLKPCAEKDCDWCLCSEDLSGEDPVVVLSELILQKGAEVYRTEFNATHYETCSVYKYREFYTGVNVYSGLEDEGVFLTLREVLNANQFCFTLLQDTLCVVVSSEMNADEIVMLLDAEMWSKNLEPGQELGINGECFRFKPSLGLVRASE